MGIQYSVAVRNAKLDAVETATGTSAIMRIRTGTPPANCAASDTGTVLANCVLPSDWMAAATAGSKAMAGTWEDLSANAAGTPGHFRIYASDGATCHVQGTVTETGNGGDLTINLPLIDSGDTFTVTSFTINAGNA